MVASIGEPDCLPKLYTNGYYDFTMVPMLAGPERVFSGAKHIIAPERVCLRALMVEMTECLKSWVRILLGR